MSLRAASFDCARQRQDRMAPLRTNWNDIRFSLSGCERTTYKTPIDFAYSHKGFQFLFYQYLLSCNRACKLTTTCLDINPSAHADRALDPGLLQRFFEYHRPLTVCRFAIVSCLHDTITL